MSLEMVRLGDVVVKAKNHDPTKKPDEVFNYIDLSAVDKDLKRITDLKPTIGKDAPSRAKQLVKQNDILVATVRPNLNGVALLDSATFESATASTGFCVLRPIHEKLDSKYLFQWVKSAAFIRDMTSKATGANYPAVSDRIIFDSLIPLPSLERQREIAAVLDKVDALRAKRRQSISKLEELLQSTFLEMFYGENADSFETKPLGEVCYQITDGAHFTPTYVDSGVPFLRVTDIQDDEIKWDNVKYIPEDEHLELIKRCYPKKGDVLYSKNGTIGIPKLIDWDLEFSIFVSLALLKPNPQIISGEFLESFLLTPFALEQAKKHTKTGTVSNLHLVEIRKVKIPCPSKVIQEKWLGKKRGIKTYQALVTQHLQQLDTLYSSLQAQFFGTGA